MKALIFIMILVLKVSTGYCQFYWDSLISGANAQVTTVCGDSVNDVLYVGGVFQIIGGIYARSIAKWDGNQFSVLGCPNGDDLQDVPSTSFFWQGYLYIGGDLVHAMDYCSGGIIGATFFKFDYAQNRWDSAATPICCAVNSICTYQGNLVVAGEIGPINGTPVQANNIAIYDGSQWIPLGDSGQYGLVYTQMPFGDLVTDAIEFNGELFVSGLFDQAAGVPLTSLFCARWNGSMWLNAGSGINFGKFCIYNNELYIATFNEIYKWNGSDWILFATAGTQDFIEDIIVWNNNLVITGKFSIINNVQANNIAIYDGNVWQPLGIGLASSGAIGFSLTTFRGSLYVGGLFSNAGGISANNVARYGPLTAIDEFNTVSLSVFPNPAGESITMQGIQVAHAIIRNSVGQICRLSNHNTRLDVSDLAEGTYSVEAMDDNGRVFMQRFIILHN